ncbi:PEP-CTERM sorting domain-containing protein [Paracraurococcus lichenis]|uniref:PEP-CTERM sorting domain-containing protein n=1 Tax=Paracraurococcus lichenis TaxID=3064888 RepID=A0ABT9EA68_9PROT|nr:PEP-CTERM sorting domain-containing protein [Paracraurococcus sp. LOR1-02]MDO9713091.1 PEP-CTERM sorting domain-containing protein [Paracraurococcus sp. LOR1-02]
MQTCRIAAAALASSIAVGGVQAAPLNGILDIELNGTVGVSGNAGTSLNAAISLVNRTLGWSGPNLAANLVITPSINSVGALVSIVTHFGTFTGIIQTEQSNPGSNGSVVSGYVLGTFTLANPLGASTIGPANLTFTFTETSGTGAAISGTYVMTPSSIPEPMSLAVFGLGLAGLGAVARSKASGADRPASALLPSRAPYPARPYAGAAATPVRQGAGTGRTAAAGGIGRTGRA